MSIADELQKLQQLHESGAISDEEFAQAKAKLLNPPPSSGPTSPASSADQEQQTKQWAMFLHLSQLVVFLVPVVGLVVPILIWQIKKAEMPGLDVHGKIVANWIISEILYGFLSIILVYVIVGIPLLMTLLGLAIVFPMIGGIKANEGEAWQYPLSIQWFAPF